MNIIKQDIQYFTLIISLLTMSFVTACGGSVELSDQWSAEDIAQIAQSVKADDIVLYGSEDCPYCQQAEAFMNKHNIAFKDCDIDTIEQCTKEYNSFNANGIPYFVIKREGKEQTFMEGFNPNYLLSMLKEAK